MVPPGAVKRSATRLSSFHFPPSTFPLSSTTVFSPPRASLSNRLSAGPDFRPYNTLISPPSVILHSSAAVVFSYLYVRSPSCCDTPLCRGSAEPGLELLSIFQPQEVSFPFFCWKLSSLSITYIFKTANTQDVRRRPRVEAEGSASVVRFPSLSEISTVNTDPEIEPWHRLSLLH